jgi:hypothetical protein
MIKITHKRETVTIPNLPAEVAVIVVEISKLRQAFTSTPGV